MKIKAPRPFDPLLSPYQRWFLLTFIVALFLLFPAGGTLADSNVPTVTHTPEPTDTPVPQQPTQTPETAATNTPYPIDLTDGDDSAEAITNITPESGRPFGFSTVNRVLLVLIGVAVVVVVGVIVYIFLDQARGGLGGP